jgi:hypothetical protein
MDITALGEGVVPTYGQTNRLGGRAKLVIDQIVRTKSTRCLEKTSLPWLCWPPCRRLAQCSFDFLTITRRMRSNPGVYFGRSYAERLNASVTEEKMSWTWQLDWGFLYS